MNESIETLEREATDDREDKKTRKLVGKTEKLSLAKWKIKNVRAWEPRECTENDERA